MTHGPRTHLPTPTELRAAVWALRRRSVANAWRQIDRSRDRAPDRELLDIVTGRFTSVDDAYTRLGRAEAHLRELTDRRSVFLTVYTEMTANVRTGIESGAFDDADWVREYLVAFADRYRTALRDFERGSFASVPLPWRIGFNASLSEYTLLVQDALLGISAHINYDLPYALRDVSIDPDRPAKRRDHDRINEVLRQLVDVVQRALAEVYDAAGYTHVDTALGPFDEEFTLVGLTEARRLAWQNAVRLTDTGSTLLRRLADWRIHTVSTGAAAFILAPNADRSTVWALRQIEGAEPPVGALYDTFQRRVRARTIDVPR